MAAQRQDPEVGRIEQDARRDAVKEHVAALYSQWYGPMVRYTCRATGLYTAAEDLVQAAFIELYRALLDGKSVSNPRAWILCVVRREIVDRIREERRHGGPPVELADVENRRELQVPPDVDFWTDTDLTRLLSGLSTREEEVVLLRAQSLKYRQIAAELDIGINSVKTLLARAIRKMQSAAATVRREGKGSRTDGKPISASLQ